MKLEHLELTRGKARLVNGTITRRLGLRHRGNDLLAVKDGPDGPGEVAALGVLPHIAAGARLQGMGNVFGCTRTGKHDDAGLGAVSPQLAQ